MPLPKGRHETISEPLRSLVGPSSVFALFGMLKDMDCSRPTPSRWKLWTAFSLLVSGSGLFAYFILLRRLF